MSVRIEYHRENNAWWAESPDAAGFAALADSFARAQALALEGLASLGFDVNRAVETVEGATLWHPPAQANLVA